MAYHLENEISLTLLKYLTSGIGVNFNLSDLSDHFKKHRNTIKTRLKLLIDNEIITRPFYSFERLLTEYPLLVISKDDLARDEKTNEFVALDPQIYAAFFFKEGVYNTLTIQFHEDLFQYQSWCDAMFEEGLITTFENQNPPEALLFSTKRMLKYKPSIGINIVIDDYNTGKIHKLKGLELDNLSLEIAKYVLKGKGIKTNENLLARRMGVNRRTIQNKLVSMLEENIITRPSARFPRAFIPPDYFFVLSLVEINDQKDAVLKYLRKDDHIPMLIKINEGRYNYFMGIIFYYVKDHLQWQEDLQNRFPNSIGAVKNTYISSAMAFSINQNYVPLQFIEKKLRSVHGREIVSLMQDDERI
ncbi:MAG: hypothetical protein EAX86_09760 [Candidatus Heimdallarchaeota archaeon]|nr:hypothetical protein [Candidatus Heimdallarchaeota archaeon]